MCTALCISSRLTALLGECQQTQLVYRLCILRHTKKIPNPSPAFSTSMRFASLVVHLLMPHSPGDRGAGCRLVSRMPQRSKCVSASEGVLLTGPNLPSSSRSESVRQWHGRREHRATGAAHPQTAGRSWSVTPRAREHNIPTGCSGHRDRLTDKRNKRGLTSANDQ